MVSKHKIEMVLTWHARGYDVQLIAHHLGLDPRAVQDILRQAAQAKTRPDCMNGVLYRQAGNAMPVPILEEILTKTLN